MSFFDVIDASILHNFQINPFNLSEEDWIKAYVAVLQISKEKKKNGHN